MEEQDETTIYNAKNAMRLSDGTLHMPTSIYSANCIKQGFAHIKPNNKDYNFWIWVIPNTYSLEQPFLSPEDIAKLRPKFQKIAEKFIEGSPEREYYLNVIPIYKTPTPQEIKRNKRKEKISFLICLPFLIVASPFIITFALCQAIYYYIRNRE